MSDAYIFGKYIRDFECVTDSVKGFISEIAVKKIKMASADINDILYVLQKVSEAWGDPEYKFRKEAFEYLKKQTGYSAETLTAGLDTVSAITSRAFLESRINSELKTKYALLRLNNIENSYEFNGGIKILPLGALLHVSASNVFISAVDSLVSGFITKNVNLLKLSRGDLYFSILFARSVKEFDVNNVFGDCFSVFYYKGGDTEIEKSLADAADGIIVWGGAGAVAEWRKKAPIKSRLIEYGPKISFSAVDLNAVRSDEQLAELCEKAALDISFFEQSACSSPQNIYLIESEKISAEYFCEKLYGALELTAQKFPCRDLSLDEKIEILKFRESARSRINYANACEGETRGLSKEILAVKNIWYSNDGSPYTVILSENPELEPTVLTRNIIVKKVHSFGEIYENIKGASFFLQAASVFCDSAMLKSAASDFMSCGVTRVLTPGYHAVPVEKAPHDGKYFLDQLVRYAGLELNDYEIYQSDLLSSGGLEMKKSVSRLRDIVSCAFNDTVYYNKIIDKNIIAASAENFLNEFKKIPFLGKAEIYNNCLPESESIISKKGLAGSYIFASGGSTGAPKFSAYSNDELEYVTDVLADIYRAAGINSRCRAANLFLAGGLWTSFIVAGKALQKIGVTSLPIGGNIDFKTIYDFFKMLKPDTIVGLPSVIVKFAEYCESKWKDSPSEKFGLNLILYGGEHFRKPARELIARLWGSPAVVSAGYAAVDCGPVGFQCGHLSGGFHHVLSDYQFVEFINSSGLPARENEAGEIVVTNLNRKLMPVIRFKTGDMGILHGGFKCGCGRTSPVFELLGRCDDIIVLGGENITPADFESAISDIAELSPVFQAVGLTRDAADALELYAELKPGLNLDEAQKSAAAERLKTTVLEKSFKVRTAYKSGWLKSFDVIIKDNGGIERVSRTGKVVAIKDKRVK